MAVLRRRHHDPRTVVAMVGGGLIGLALWASLAPAPVAELEAVPVATPRATEPRVPPEPSNRPRAAVDPQRPEVVPEGGRARTGTVGVRRHDDTGHDGPASVVIDIVDPDGRPAEQGQVVAVDCDGFEPGPEAGQYRAEPGPCTVQAVRKDGLLWARSARVTVDLLAGGDNYLQLELESTRTGGVGVRFQPVGMGMQVLEVVPHTPAWESGVEAGDVITAVNGTSVDQLSVDDFVQAMTGPEGSEVELTVAYPTDEGPETETLRVVRQFLDG